MLRIGQHGKDLHKHVTDGPADSSTQARIGHGIETVQRAAALGVALWEAGKAFGLIKRGRRSGPAPK